MADSFDMVIFIRTMRKEYPEEDLFIEKSNDKRIRIRPEDDVHDVCGMVVVVKKERDIAINPSHIISIINRGGL